MVRRLLIVLLFVLPFGGAVSAEPPLVVHVTVALCDNASQGIVPVPAASGDGDDPRTNQQQINVTTQAAVTEGIAMIYALDAAVAPKELSDRVAASLPPSAASDAADELRRVTREASDDVLEASSDFAYGARATIEAAAAALEELSDTTYASLLHAIKLAGTAACLAAMIKSPEQHEAYDEVLAAIRRLG